MGCSVFRRWKEIQTKCACEAAKYAPNSQEAHCLQACIFEKIDVHAGCVKRYKQLNNKTRDKLFEIWQQYTAMLPDIELALDAVRFPKPSMVTLEQNLDTLHKVTKVEPLIQKLRLVCKHAVENLPPSDLFDLLQDILINKLTRMDTRYSREHLEHCDERELMAMYKYHPSNYLSNWK